MFRLLNVTGRLVERDREWTRKTEKWRCVRSKTLAKNNRIIDTWLATYLIEAKKNLRFIKLSRLLVHKMEKDVHNVYEKNYTILFNIYQNYLILLYNVELSS